MWFNILKADDEKDEEKYKRRRAGTHFMTDLMENELREMYRHRPPLDPKDPMSKDVIDAKESLNEVEIRLKKLKTEEYELNQELKEKRAAIRNLKRQRREQKLEEE